MATTLSRPTITDDNGTGTTGTVLDAAWLSNFEDRIDALFGGAAVFDLGGALALGRYTTTATGTQNNWDLDTANSGTTVGVLRCNNASALTINGITAPSTHRLLVIEAINSTVNLAHEAAGSTAANRVTTPTAATVAIPSGGYAFLLYDVTTARWRVLSPHATRIDDLAAAADNTNLNVSTSAHGLVPKVSGSDGYTLQKSGTGAVWAAATGGGTTTEQTTTATGNQDDFAITNSGLTILRCTGAAPVFRGFKVAGTTPTAGDRVLIVCLGTTAKVANQDTNSTAAYRIITPSTQGQIVGLNGVIQCTYDGTTGRWREVLLDPGNPIAVTYASGDFTGSGTITWTVDSGDLEAFWYQQFGKVLQVNVSIATSTVSGSGAELRVKIPGGFTTTRFAASPLIMGFDNNIATPVNQFVNAADTNLHFGRQDAGNWAAATNTTYIRGQQTFEVD